MNNSAITIAIGALVFVMLISPVQAAEVTEVPEVVRIHAPVLSFHPEEGSQCCYPSDAEEAFKNLDCYFFPFCEGYPFRVPKTLNPNTPCYFQIAEGPQLGVPYDVTRIKYWFWYNFNDFPEGPDLWGSHTGDWESVEVVLINGKVHVYLLSSHGDENIPGGYIPVWPDEAILENGHIKVWAGSGSHANYPSPNSTVYCDEEVGLHFCDHIADGGSVWYTMNNLKPIVNSNFAGYEGHWGDPGSPTNTVEENRQFENKIPYYKIWVYTGYEDDAGTDADVYVTLFGTNGVSSELELDNYEDNFERGAIDVFSPGTNYDFGDLYRINIRHDDSGRYPGWFLDKVVIENPLTNIRWIFTCNRWLATDEDDGEIERTLDGVPVFSLYFYFDYDVSFCFETFTAGSILQFLTGVKVSAACPSGDFIQFLGEPYANTWLFSSTRTVSGELVGIRIYNGGIKLYNNGSIKFH